jgi:hypothetical protein
MRLNDISETFSMTNLKVITVYDFRFTIWELRFMNNNNFKHKQMKISISSRKMVKGFATLLLISLIAAGCFSSSNGIRRTTGEEPFFQQETGLAEHGKKSTIDRIYQIDREIKCLRSRISFIPIRPEESQYCHLIIWWVVIIS